MRNTNWEKLLIREDMPPEPKNEQLGRRIGIGLGIKSLKEEKGEDNGYHSFMCPLNLGTGINTKIDQPHNRPVEED
jgi:hypothetical protein